MSYLYVVATNKEVLVTVRIAATVRDDFKIAAELRGSTMSGLLHQFIVRTIREEREAEPHAFRVRSLKAVNARVVGTIEPGGRVIERRRIQRELDAPIGKPAKRRKTG